MKNLVAVVIIIIILAVGGIFIFGKGGVENTQTETDTTVGSTMPTIDASDDVVDMVVGGESPVKEFTITAENFSYTPAIISVNKGDKVSITLDGKQGFHDLVVDEFDVATKQSQSPFVEVVEFVADKTGSFEFYCSVGSHRAMGMKGTLEVK